jgi:uncharacterized protein with GYD domain
MHPERSVAMPHYMIQLSYTPEAYVNLVKNPQDRFAIVGVAIEKAGGKLEGAWLAFGEYDAVCIVQMPDNVSVAAFGMAVVAGGAVKSYKTTPLLTTAEGVAAMQKASTTGYRPPAG